MKNIIIIGSGIGGLVAGNLLVRKGHKVTIFEAHGMPGGYTGGFYREGFYFESGTVSFESSASVFKAMKDIGMSEKVEFVKKRLRLVSEDFDGIPENFDDCKKLIFAAFPSDQEKLRMVFSELDKIAGPMGKMNRPLPTLFSGFELIGSILPFIPNAPKLIKISKQFGSVTSSEFAARYFEKASKLYRLFNGFGYPDMSAVMVGSSLAGLFTDLWTVKDGMQSWADALAENFVKLGGDLKTCSCVDRIITKNGAAAGVSCKNTVYDADVVISAGDYKRTFLKLLDDRSLIEQTLRDGIKNASVSESYFTVYLGLGLSNEELSRLMKVSHILLLNFRPGFDIYNLEDSEFFSKASAEIYSPSMINPALAPEGKSSLMIQTKVPYRFMNNWGGGDRGAYRQLKENATDAMIDFVSRLIPGLRERIEYRDAATPLTYERFTHNTDGASCAWCWNPKKMFYKSGVSVNVETPVNNLYIGSCWATQLGGVPGALSAAYQCANKIR